jgi:hypothetical protein
MPSGTAKDSRTITQILFSRKREVDIWPSLRGGQEIQYPARRNPNPVGYLSAMLCKACVVALRGEVLGINALEPPGDVCVRSRSQSRTSNYQCYLLGNEVYLFMGKVTYLLGLLFLAEALACPTEAHDLLDALEEVLEYRNRMAQPDEHYDQLLMHLCDELYYWARYRDGDPTSTVDRLEMLVIREAGTPLVVPVLQEIDASAFTDLEVLRKVRRDGSPPATSPEPAPPMTGAKFKGHQLAELVESLELGMHCLLGINEPDIPEWLKKLLEKLEAVEGESGPGDPAEDVAPERKDFTEDDEDVDTSFDGEPLPYGHCAGTASHRIEPQPYLVLVEKVQPLVRRLVEELAIEPAVPPPEPSERGGRLSLHQYLRDSDHPFTLPQEDRPAPPTLTFRVVIDHSTSMNVDRRMEYAAQAAMLLHLAAVELAIPHRVVVTPDDIRIADLDTGEMGLTLIAGIIPAQTGWEDTGLAVSRHGTELAAMSEDIKRLLVIHDGMGNDHELLASECKRLRDKVLILGVGIGMGEMEAGLLKEQFGPDRYIHCASPEELSQKVGAVLRAVRGA